MGSVVGDVLGKNQSPPPSPDYTGAAIAQGQANLQAGQQSASLSNPNIYGPYGQQTVTYTPTGPDGSMQPNVYQTLAPSQQALLNQQNALKMGLANLGSDALSRVGGVMSTPFQFNGPDVQMSLGDAGPITMSANQNGRLDLSGVAKMPINAGTTALQAGLSRLMPTLNQQRTSLETNLTNQGLRPGAEAWSNAMRDQSMRENDLQAALVRDSLGLDLTANQQGFGQALQQGQFGNQANLTNAQFANAAQQQQFGQNQAAAQFGNQAQQQAERAERDDERVAGESAAVPELPRSERGRDAGIRWRAGSGCLRPERVFQSGRAEQRDDEWAGKYRGDGRVCHVRPTPEVAH
jgi:hypothetical protein